ncbi:hypothetical protein [Bacillus sp. FJAT-27916]|uniref:hypothetical protein n=1 Tax=Bacillus sp. FJAT-27916 TaxID=1679169 RepID=UPI0006714D12|nr:hypothetical protein [Bacillus sp. FJAT-27916]
MSYFTIGSLTIPAVWLAVLLSLFITSLLYRFASERRIDDWYWNSFFLYFIVWKLSYIPFHFDMFLDIPLSIAYFNGGINGHFLALVSLSIYLFYISEKKRQPIHRDAVELFLLFFIVFETIKYALETNVPAALLHLLLLIGYVVLLKRKKQSLSSQVFFLFFLLELFIISFFQSVLSLEILTFSWMAVIACILSIRDHAKPNSLGGGKT